MNDFLLNSDAPLHQYPEALEVLSENDHQNEVQRQKERKTRQNQSDRLQNDKKRAVKLFDENQRKFDRLQTLRKERKPEQHRARWMLRGECI